MQRLEATQKDKLNEATKDHIYDKGCSMAFILSLIPENIKKKIAICRDHLNNPDKSYQGLSIQHGIPKTTVKRYCDQCNEIL